jgi:hypothetical protein
MENVGNRERFTFLSGFLLDPNRSFTPIARIGRLQSDHTRTPKKAAAINV